MWRVRGRGSPMVATPFRLPGCGLAGLPGGVTDGFPLRVHALACAFRCGRSPRRVAVLGVREGAAGVALDEVELARGFLVAGRVAFRERAQARCLAECLPGFLWCEVAVEFLAPCGGERLGVVPVVEDGAIPADDGEPAMVVSCAAGGVHRATPMAARSS